MAAIVQPSSSVYVRLLALLHLGMSRWHIAGLLVVMFVAVHFILKRIPPPDLPVLRISRRWGLLGTFEDLQTFVDDNMRLCDVGWERYSKHGLNYVMNSPQGRYVVLAPRFTDELIRTPDTILNAEATQNLVRLISLIGLVTAKEQI
jgi:hypothetical protein